MFLVSSTQAIFVTGTDTNIGKTVVCASLVKALKADYWKPMQCGDLENSDTQTLQKLLGPHYEGTLHTERYRFQLPQSPHLAAKSEGVSIRLEDFILPRSSRPLIVEGAGGCLVPLNDEETMLDLAVHLNLPVILVTRFYLGTYNHTLLSIEAMRSRGIRILGLVLNGGDDRDFRDYISRKTKLEFLGILPKWESLNSQDLELNPWGDSLDE